MNNACKQISSIKPIRVMDTSEDTGLDNSTSAHVVGEGLCSQQLRKRFTTAWSHVTRKESVEGKKRPRWAECDT